MRSVTVESWRIGVVLAIMLGITAWQFSFVINAISANPALNLVILGTFLFGLTLVFGVMHSFRNEYHAFYALIELFDDINSEARGQNTDPLWRYYRATRYAIPFSSPKILGQSYQLVTAQLRRDGRLQISPSTMQTLVDGIDSRLVGARSLISYVAGTLIFLGLIGTFVGLMVTLASVGDILGGLDLSGADPVATVAALMNNLQVPLGGMATGFSSSLFGLVASLTLSIMIQLISRAGGNLRADFSDWLSNAVQLDEGGMTEEHQLPATAGGQIEERRLALLMKTARHTLQSTSRHARALESMNENITILVEEGHENRQALADVTSSLRTLSDQNRVIHSALARSIDAFRTVSKAVNTRAEIAELTTLMASHRETHDQALRDSLRHIHSRISELQRPSLTPDSEEEERSALIQELAQHSDELNLRQINKLLSTVYRQDEGAPKDDGLNNAANGTGTEG